MGRVIQHLEVFCELCAKTSPTSSVEETVVLVIEILKAVLRISRLTIAEETMMLVDWDRKGDISALSSYLKSYKDEFRKQLTTIQRELSMLAAFEPRTRRSVSAEDSCVIGRRSGLVLSLSEGLSSAVRLRSETQRSKENSTNRSPETVSTSSTASPLLCDTPLRERERESVSERPLLSQTNRSESSLFATSTATTIFTTSSLSPEQVLYYSEVLSLSLALSLSLIMVITIVAVAVLSPSLRLRTLCALGEALQST